MHQSEFQHRFAGGLHAYVRCWKPDAAPRGIVQVIHGMAEHSARYARLAAALTDAGFAVYAHDLPGHGPLSEDWVRGHFADRRGWRVAIASIRDVQRLAQRAHPGQPVYMLGHSMGSFLLQHYVADSGGTLAGAIFSATTGDFGRTRKLGLALLRAEAMIYGRRHPSLVGEKLSFAAFNKKFKPARTAFDWLSRDPKEVDKYVKDPDCGYRCTTGLWIDLLEAGAMLTAPPRLRRIPKTLSVLMLAGSEDPVSAGAHGPRTLEQKYLAAGIRDVTVHVYPDARHELFNDLCRDAATRDLCAWLNAHPAAVAAKAS